MSKTNLCSKLGIRPISPTANRCVVALERSPAETEGGIALPEQHRKHTEWGRVLATGPDVKNVAPGDRVFTDKHAGTRYEENGADVLIVEETKILAVETA